MKPMRNSPALSALAVLILSCNGYVGEVESQKPSGPPIPIVDPDYVILRPVSETPAPGFAPATVDNRTVYFNPKERIVDLRHFDPRTATVEAGPMNSFVVSIRTTPDGEKLLGAWTAANIHKRLGVFVGNQLISAPHVESRIDGGIVLDGGYQKTDAERVLARLRRGGAAG